jgi:hypothetical protein
VAGRSWAETVVPRRQLPWRFKLAPVSPTSRGSFCVLKLGDTYGQRISPSSICYAGDREDTGQSEEEIYRMLSDHRLHDGTPGSEATAEQWIAEAERRYAKVRGLRTEGDELEDRAGMLHSPHPMKH